MKDDDQDTRNVVSLAEFRADRAAQQLARIGADEVPRRRALSVHDNWRHAKRIEIICAFLMAIQ